MKKSPPVFAACAVALWVTALSAGGGCRSSPEPEQLFAEAENLRLLYEKDASRRAIVKYAQARAAWQRKDDKIRAAQAGQKIGATYEQLGEPRASLDGYLSALSLARSSGDRLLESELHSEVGVAQSLAGEAEGALDEASRHCRMALTLAKEFGGARQEAKALNCLGEVDYHRGNLELALNYYRQAEPLWSRSSDARGQAETLLFAGYVRSDLSDFKQARADYDRALLLWTSLGDKRGRAITLVADARLRQRLGEYQEALNRFLQALTLFEPMGDALWEAGSLTGIATIYLQMAESERALKYWERALQRFEAAGLKNYSTDVLISLGATYLASGDETKALNRLERALVLADELGNRRWQSNALRYLGLVYLHQRQPLQARRNLERSLSVQRLVGDRRLSGQTRADLGEAHDLLGERTVALAYFKDSVTLSRDAGDRIGEARALFGLGRTSLGLGNLESAREYIARSLNVTESLRGEVESRELRASYLASVHQYYELNVEVLMRLHELSPRAGLAAAAFEAAERARARSLLDNLAQAGVDLHNGVDPDLLKRESAAKKGFDDWAARRIRNTGPAQQAEVEAYRNLEDTYQQIQAEIRSRSPRYASLTQPQPLSLADVQSQVLDGETLLLAYSLGEERSFLWALSKTDHASYVLLPRAEIEQAVQRVYDRLTARLNITGNPRERRLRIEQADDEYWHEAQRLSEMVLRPVAAKMRNRRILVVADGALQYLPFAALPIPDGGDAHVPLVLEHEIVSLPSASVLAAVRHETRNRPPAAGSVAVLADPVFEDDDPRLVGAAQRAVAPSRLHAVNLSGRGTPVSVGFPRDDAVSVPRLAATRQEADAIVAAAPLGTTLKAIDFDASRATAMSPNLAKYRVLHFATHGVFSNDQPGLAGIVLSMFDNRGQAQDGVLRLHDIYNLNLPAELVVLSACNTALGKSVKGEGLVGIVRGFMYAGAKRVVASHWKVDDEATGELMGRFYVQMLKENRSPAAALRQAQLAMRQQERWRAPFYWAAFVLQGEWN